MKTKNFDAHDDLLISRYRVHRVDISKIAFGSPSTLANEATDRSAPFDRILSDASRFPRTSNNFSLKEKARHEIRISNSTMISQGVFSRSGMFVADKKQRYGIFTSGARNSTAKRVVSQRADPSPTNGSSSNRMPGRVIRALAMATRRPLSARQHIHGSSRPLFKAQLRSHSTTRS